MRKLVAVNTIMGMEEIEKLDILQEYQKRLPQYDIVESTDKYFKNKSTNQLRYDRIIINKILKERKNEKTSKMFNM